jgi:uncharacterized protein YbjQ (UPF0145 family)
MAADKQQEQKNFNPFADPCPKCGYIRKADDDAPDYQCPQCDVVYRKAFKTIEEIGDEVLAVKKRRQEEAEEIKRRAEEARIEAERRAAEEEKARIEAEKRAAEEARIEAERQAAEQARIEAERRAAEEEKARIEAEKQAAEEARIEAERQAAEQARIEAERRAAAEEKARVEAEKQAATEAESNVAAGSQDSVKLTTTDNIDGYSVVKYIGIESVEVIVGVGELEDRLQKAKQIAFDQLKHKAFEKGADAVIGINIGHAEFSENRIAIIVYGTLVRLTQKN